MLMPPTTVYDIKNELKVKKSVCKMKFFPHVAALDKHHSPISPHVELFLYISVDPNYS